QTFLDAVIEIAFAPTIAIKGEQWANVRIRDRAAEGAAAHICQDLTRARLFVLGEGWPAHKQARTARRFAESAGIVWSGDEDVAHLRRQVARVWHLETLQSGSIQPDVHFSG